MPIATPAVGTTNCSQTDMLNFSIDSILQKPCSHPDSGTLSSQIEFPGNFLSLRNDGDMMRMSDHLQQFSSQYEALNWLKAGFYSTWKSNDIASQTISNHFLTSNSSTKSSTTKPNESLRSHSASSSKNGRSPRVPFSKYQVQELEAKFQKEKYLSSLDVSELSNRLNLTEIRVKIWFQNRRARERRDQQAKCRPADDSPTTIPPHNLSYPLIGNSSARSYPNSSSIDLMVNRMLSPCEIPVNQSNHVSNFLESSNFSFPAMFPPPSSNNSRQQTFGDYHRLQVPANTYPLKSSPGINK